MEKIRCEGCQKGKKLYFSDDKKEIEEIRKKQVIKKMKLFCKIAKEKAEKEPEKVLGYVKAVNPFDVSYEEWNDGFLREPKTNQEKKEAMLFCLIEPFEPEEVCEYDKVEIDECPDYKPKEAKKKRRAK